MATTTAISPVSRLGVLLAGLLLAGPAWPASRVTTQPYRGADALRGLDTPPTVTEIRHLDPTTGYLKVSVLTMRTPGEVARAFIQLGGVERLSLDLRGNGAAASTPRGMWPSCSCPQITPLAAAAWMGTRGVRHTSGVSVEALLMTGRRWR
jgi:hypothetical protein